MKRTTESQASKSGSFRFTEQLCEYYNANNSFCSVGQGRCLTEGRTDDCKMYRFYMEKVSQVRPKRFEERYPNYGRM